MEVNSIVCSPESGLQIPGDFITSPVSGDVRTFEHILNMTHAHLKEIKLVREEIKLLKEEVSNMKGTVHYLSNMYDMQQSKIETLEEENKELNRGLEMQATSLEELDQYSKKE